MALNPSVAREYCTRYRTWLASGVVVTIANQIRILSRKLEFDDWPGPTDG